MGRQSRDTTGDLEGQDERSHRGTGELNGKDEHVNIAGEGENESDQRGSQKPLSVHGPSLVPARHGARLHTHNATDGLGVDVQFR